MDKRYADILGILPPTPPRRPRAAFVPAALQSPPQNVINANYQQLNIPAVSKSSDDMVLRFHNDAISIIREESGAAAQALKNLDNNLRQEVQLARAASIARLAILAVQARLQNAAVPLARAIYEARQIVDAAMNREPADPAAAVRWYAKVAEVRRQVEDLGDSDLVDAASRLAQLGDETWPEVFLNSISVKLPEGIAEQFTEVYQRAVAGPQVELLESAAQGLDEVKAVIGVAELVLNTTFTSLGTDQRWKLVPQDAIVKAWPKPAKAAFIAAKGEDAYTSLLQGDLDFGVALGVFRPGLVTGD
ncbi:MAG: hypothetical protein ABSH53_02925 [Holophaga sp.]|jgi:hypothetical protein